MTITFRISFLLGMAAFLHHLNELVEQTDIVLGTGGGLQVELDPVHLVLLVFES
jgi:hypothetical protein